MLHLRLLTTSTAFPLRNEFSLAHKIHTERFLTHIRLSVCRWIHVVIGLLVLELLENGSVARVPWLWVLDAIGRSPGPRWPLNFKDGQGVERTSIHSGLMIQSKKFNLKPNENMNTWKRNRLSNPQPNSLNEVVLTETVGIVRIWALKTETKSAWHLVLRLAVEPR